MRVARAAKIRGGRTDLSETHRLHDGRDGFDDYPVLPVRTETEIPKDKIPALMELVNNFTLKNAWRAARSSSKTCSIRA